MKTLSVEHISKKFQEKNWIFKDFSINLSTGDSCAILGANGSGKSTLIKILSGYLTPSEGKISLKTKQQEIDGEHYFQHVSMAAPWFELIEDFNLDEYLSFHRKFRKIVANLSNDDLLHIANLVHAKKLPIRDFSSGMKQRVRLLLAFFTESDILLLDEPTANLDSQNIAWYQTLIEQYTQNRITFIASNHIGHEYNFCQKKYEIADGIWKQI